MNYIEQIFARCNIETLCDFLMHGGELAQTSSDGYYERARKAEKQLSDWLQQQFADSAELSEHAGLLHAVLSEIQSVYMQIGLQAGIMLAAEFGGTIGRTKLSP